MTTEQSFRLIGDKYHLIKGMNEYIEERRSVDPEGVDEFIQNLSNVPTVYYKTFEVLLAEGNYPMVVANKAKVRFLSNDSYQFDINRRMFRDEFSVVDLAKFLSGGKHEDYVVPLEPDVDYLAFEMMVGDEIMQDVERDFKENGYEQYVTEFRPKVTFAVDIDEKKRDMANKAVAAKAAYAEYMADMKERDPQEYSRMSKLHAIYKKENEKFLDIEKQIAAIDRKIEEGNYAERWRNRDLSAKEEKRWDELEDKKYDLLKKRVDLIRKYDEDNQKRVEKGIISERHAAIRHDQLYREDYASLPMRTLEETIAAGQFSNYDIDPETQAKHYNIEDEITETFQGDNVTRNVASVVAEDALLAHKRMVELSRNGGVTFEDFVSTDDIYRDMQRNSMEGFGFDLGGFKQSPVRYDSEESEIDDYKIVSVEELSDDEASSEEVSSDDGFGF